MRFVVLHFPAYKAIPLPEKSTKLIEVPVCNLHPTQWCIGLAEVISRQNKLCHQTKKERLNYLKYKPVPLVRSANGESWMIDRHHLLYSLLGIDPDSTTWGYVIAKLPFSDRLMVLEYLKKQGWLYLYNSRGNGPLPSKELPNSLLELEDDPYRSLVWRLKKEGLIKPQRHIPYHEFHWASWLRLRSLPPFSSYKLEPAFIPAKRLVCARSASNMAGWIQKNEFT